MLCFALPICFSPPPLSVSVSVSHTHAHTVGLFYSYHLSITRTISPVLALRLFPFCYDTSFRFDCCCCYYVYWTYRIKTGFPLFIVFTFSIEREKKLMIRTFYIFCIHTMNGNKIESHQNLTAATQNIYKHRKSNKNRPIQCWKWDFFGVFLLARGIDMQLVFSSAAFFFFVWLYSILHLPLLFTLYLRQSVSLPLICFITSPLFSCQFLSSVLSRCFSCIRFLQCNGQNL